MLLPSIFNNNFVDRFFDDDFDDMFSFPSFGVFPMAGWMNTNIKDLGDEYQLEIELPGFDKKDITAHLDKGYLTITAIRQDSREKKDRKGRYIRRERYSGSLKRSFYVGENLKEEDFKASFENGVLTIVFPKDKTAARLEHHKYIPIE
jgi:Hsp20/alpha crystallin family.